MNRFIAILCIALYWVSVPAWSAVTIQKPDGMETPPAQIAASPSRIELEIGKKPANSSIKLFNLSDKPVTVSTSVHHWDLDEANKVRVIEPTPANHDANVQILREELAWEGTSVIIARRTCLEAIKRRAS